jgi:hypothetical protein
VVIRRKLEEVVFSNLQVPLLTSHMLRALLFLCPSNVQQSYGVSVVRVIATDFRSIVQLCVHYNAAVEHYISTGLLRMHELRYEDLVNTPNTTLRQAMLHLELPWDERCWSAFHKSEMRSSTASREQVKQPLYKKSLNKSRRFGEYTSTFARILADIPVLPVPVEHHIEHQA